MNKAIKILINKLILNGNLEMIILNLSEITQSFLYQKGLLSNL